MLIILLPILMLHIYMGVKQSESFKSLKAAEISIEEALSSLVKRYGVIYSLISIILLSTFFLKEFLFLIIVSLFSSVYFGKYINKFIFDKIMSYIHSDKPQNAFLFINIFHISLFIAYFMASLIALNFAPIILNEFEELDYFFIQVTIILSIMFFPSTFIPAKENINYCLRTKKHLS